MQVSVAMQVQAPHHQAQAPRCCVYSHSGEPCKAAFRGCCMRAGLSRACVRSPGTIARDDLHYVQVEEFYFLWKMATEPKGLSLSLDDLIKQRQTAERGRGRGRHDGRGRSGGRNGQLGARGGGVVKPLGRGDGFQQRGGYGQSRGGFAGRGRGGFGGRGFQGRGDGFQAQQFQLRQQFQQNQNIQQRSQFQQQQQFPPANRGGFVQARGGFAQQQRPQYQQNLQLQQQQFQQQYQDQVEEEVEVFEEAEEVPPPEVLLDETTGNVIARIEVRPCAKLSRMDKASLACMRHTTCMQFHVWHKSTLRTC